MCYFFRKCAVWCPTHINLTVIYLSCIMPLPSSWPMWATWLKLRGAEICLERLSSELWVAATENANKSNPWLISQSVTAAAQSAVTGQTDTTAQWQCMGQQCKVKSRSVFWNGGGSHFSLLSHAIASQSFGFWMATSCFTWPCGDLVLPRATGGQKQAESAFNMRPLPTHPKHNLNKIIIITITKRNQTHALQTSPPPSKHEHHNEKKITNKRKQLAPKY